MALTEYQHKRHFNRTPEPRGKVKRRQRGGLSFVIQKHDATRLHYDFRLELDGVLKSWAVPKGPSFDPKEKRLAVQVEDHPLDYADFEGIIPEGEYGGGTVAVWDRGVWKPGGDPHAGYRAGKLKFHLEGDKLRGGWTLIRLARRGNERATNWLLIKERDEEARSTDEYDVVDAEPNSVATGRSLDEIAAARDRVWGSNRSGKKNSTVRLTKGSGFRVQGSAKGARPHKVVTKKRAPATKKTARAKKSTSRRSKKRGSSDSLPEGVRRAAMSTKIEMQLATLAKQPPTGDQWLHEIKFDGYRIICRLDRRARLLTRGDQDWTGRMPTIAKAAETLPVDQAILDGEVVALLPNGVSSFQALQNAFRGARSEPLVYYAFDLLYLDGHDLRGMPLEERKARLAELLDHNTSRGAVRYAEHVEGEGDRFFAESCRVGLEGIISKRRDRGYVAGRGFDWLKTKCVRRDEFVIGGFTEPAGARHGLGALLVGYYAPPKRFVYAGRVGTGFSDRLLGDLRKRLDRLEQPRSPFADFPQRSTPRGTHWVRPQLVGQIEFSNWTDDRRLRHPSFQGLREDKPAVEITRDEPQEVSKVTRENGHPRRKSNEPKRAATAQRESHEVAGVRLTHPDKVLYAEQRITKLGLAEFYEQIADWILPHLVDRPLSLVRCPEGPRKTCFYQKHLGPSAPRVLGRVTIQEKSKTNEYSVVKNIAGIVALVQMGVLEIHPWGARADDVERPDRLTFDFDPSPELGWSAVVDAARRLRTLLESIDLESFVKTSGGKGLHVVVPIRRRLEWPEVKAFCKSVVQRLANDSPENFTVNPLKATRKNKIFLDYLRNDRGATSVAAYSTRARSGAPVSVPIAWDELRADLRADYFNVENLPERLRRLRRDPWEALPKLRQSITAAARKAVTS
ncbi:MAG TPA: DNA ligase D [Pirellulales bacterium]|nr:DNA ligase D [Pirellulales bacterium]